jgi:hypothetical protein
MILIFWICDLIRELIASTRHCYSIISIKKVKKMVKGILNLLDFDSIDSKSNFVSMHCN